MRPLADLWALDEFRTGLAVGVPIAALLAIAALGRARPWPARSPLPLGGAAIAAGALVGIALTRTVPVPLLVGVVGVGATAGIGERYAVPVGLRMLATLPFAWLVADHSGLVASTAIRSCVFLVASIGAVLAARFDDLWAREAPTPALFGLVAVGAYFTLPDTEEIGTLLGIALPLAVLGWPTRLVRLGAGGAAASVAMLAWVAGTDGRGRPTSTIGAAVCLGVLAGWPIGARWLQRGGPVLARAPRPVVLGALGSVHLFVVLLGSRVAGLHRDLPSTLPPALLAGIAAVSIGAVVGPVRRAPPGVR